MWLCAVRGPGRARALRSPDASTLKLTPYYPSVQGCKALLRRLPRIAVRVSVAKTREAAVCAAVLAAVQGPGGPQERSRGCCGAGRL